VIHAPRITPPPDGFALHVAPPEGETGEATVQQTATPTPHVAPVASSIAQAPTSTETSAPTAVASSVSVTPTVGDGWSATPAFYTPAPAPPLTDAALALAGTIEAEFGVRVLTEGQDWGEGEAEQVRNLAAVSYALASVPEGVLSAANANSAGPLTFLSNSSGRTEDGWQPYGDRAANFYTNEDRGPAGRTAANQVVLQPGSASQTIAHEVVHAYQMRGLAPGDYVSALLTPEMKSFMATTGWRQLAPDDEVRAAGGSWEAINALFVYEGRFLEYTNQYGDRVTLFAPNPLEAFAEAAGLYYAHPDGTTLPDWPDYWDWFDANIG
jgi:hypothetical protein